MTEKAGNDGDGPAGVIKQCDQERTIVLALAVDPHRHPSGRPDRRAWCPPGAGLREAGVHVTVCAWVSPWTVVGWRSEVFFSRPSRCLKNDRIWTSLAAQLCVSQEFHLARLCGMTWTWAMLSSPRARVLFAGCYRRRDLMVERERGRPRGG